MIFYYALLSGGLINVLNQLCRCLISQKLLDININVGLWYEHLVNTCIDV